MPFSPSHFGYLSSHCLSACPALRGGQRAQRMCCEFTVIPLLFEQFCSPRTSLHIISTQTFSWQAIHVRLIRAQAVRLAANTFFSTHPVLVQSVMSLVINSDHSVTPWSVASSLSHTHISIHISSRPAGAFLHLQLHAYLMHSVFSQAIIAAGKGSPWFG